MATAEPRADRGAAMAEAASLRGVLPVKLRPHHARREAGQWHRHRNLIALPDIACRTSSAGHRVPNLGAPMPSSAAANAATGSFLVEAGNVEDQSALLVVQPVPQSALRNGGPVGGRGGGRRPAAGQVP